MITAYQIIFPLFRKAKASLMLWLGFDLCMSWGVSGHLWFYVCSPFTQPMVVRHSKLRARDGAWVIHLCQASSPIPCPIAAHLCWACPELHGMSPNPSLLREYVIHYLFAFLWECLGREEQDQLNKIWSSPSRKFSHLSRLSCRLLQALVVFRKIQIFLKPRKEFVQSSVILLKLSARMYT